MRILSKKSKTIIAAAAIIGLTGSGVAYSFWTIGGTGGGTASTGTVVGITVNQTSSVAGLYPGGPAQSISGNFDNGNAGPVYVTSVSATLGLLPSGCVPADFTISGTAPVNTNVASGSGVGSWGGTLAITMNNTGSNQDGCKVKSIPLVLTSS